MAENYLMIIIEGWINNYDFLENYFYREFKKANSENVPPGEFISYLNRAMKEIDDRRLQPFYRQLEMWNDYYIQETRKGNKVDLSIPDNADSYSTPLLFLTNGKYSGQIGKADLDYIKDRIDKAFEKITCENKNEKPEVAKWFDDWLNMTTDEKYNYSLAAYKRKFPNGSIEDFHLLEKEHLLERIENYKTIVSPDAFEIKAKIEREKLLKYIDELDKEVPAQQTKTESLKEIFEFTEQVPSNFEQLKKYIRNNYLSVHPNKQTLETLERIKRNISKWSLILNDLNEAQELQQFISKTMADIDLQIERYSKIPQAQPTSQSSQPKFIANEYALAYILDLYANGKQIPYNRIEGGFDAKELKQTGTKRGLKGDTFYRAVMKVAKYDLNKKEHLEAISKDWLRAVKVLSKDWNTVLKYLEAKQLLKE